MKGKHLITKYNFYIDKINEALADEIKLKVGKALMWININKGFYGELLAHVNIYGSNKLNPKTMCTDCETFIAFHPEFVQQQENAAVRFVLCHEILHIIGQHNQRRGGRNHDLWNIACDYAINPILKSDSSFGSDFKFPTRPDGTVMGLFEERFVGMRAEDIYDILISEGKKPDEKESEEGEMGNMSGQKVKPDENMIVQVRVEDEDEGQEQNEPKEAGKKPGSSGGTSSDEEGEEGEEGEGQGVGEGEEQDESEDKKDVKKPQFVKKTPKGGVDNSKKSADSVKRDATKGDLLSGNITTNTGNTVSKIYQGKHKTNWDALGRSAMARHSSTLSETSKSLLRSSIGDKALVNWKGELRKFFDASLTGRQSILPNKRLLAGGTILYGTKKVGISTLKTIVCAIDTSSSISHDQMKTFLNEVMYLCKKYNADKTIIIYCSDDIDDVDIIKKGGTPDMSKVKSSGGNARGFIPPFEWVEKHHINPSVFIYLTDTGGEMPDKNKYGIGKYAKKVIWFICSSSVHNQPPFGKTLFMPVSSIQE